MGSRPPQLRFGDVMFVGDHGVEWVVPPPPAMKPKSGMAAGHVTFTQHPPCPCTSFCAGPAQNNGSP